MVGTTTNFHSAKLQVAGKVFLASTSGVDYGGTLYGWNDTSRFPAEGGLKFQYFNYDGSSYAMRDGITMNGVGNVGINTTNPSWRLDVRGTGMFNGDLQLDIGELNVPKSLLFNSNSTTGGSYGNLKWYNVQWDGYTRAEIVVEGDGALSNGRMVFKTGASGANAVERMRITSGGVLMVNNTGSVFHSANMVVAGKLFIPFQANADIGGIIYTYNDTTYATYEGGIRFQTFKYNGSTFSMQDAMTLNGQGNLELSTGSIKTGEPGTGWGKSAIKIGASVSGAAFNVTRYLPVSVDGTIYYINLNSSTP